MTPSSLAGHVVELLDEIVKTGFPADKIISDFYKQRRYLGSHDRRWVTNKTYGIIRNFILLREIGKGFASESRAVETFLIYEILFAGMKAEEIQNVYSQLLASYRLAGSEVDLEKLSNLAAKKFDTLKSDRNEFLLNSFPEFFLDLLPSSIKADSVPIMKALNVEGRVCIRVDTAKISRDEVIGSFQKDGIESLPSKFSPYGVYLSKRINLNNNELYKSGKIEVQEEASQLVGLVVNPGKDEIVVDACAGAGGKSLEFASLSRGTAKIFALDVNRERLDGLKVRAVRNGYDNIVSKLITNDDFAGVEELIGSADKVIVDAPCTGSGTIRRNPDKKFRLTKLYVEKNSLYQRSLIQKYSRLVKAGGLLFYVTCSIFEAENQSVVKSFVDSNPNFQFVDVAQILTDPCFSNLIENGFLVIYPHRVEMDGFFVAVMKRSK
jgi:16S rRNA (cytosine967-C5)-methyltransferase